MTVENREPDLKALNAKLGEDGEGGRKIRVGRGRIKRKSGVFPGGSTGSGKVKVAFPGLPL